MDNYEVQHDGIIISFDDSIFLDVRVHLKCINRGYGPRIKYNSHDHPGAGPEFQFKKADLIFTSHGGSVLSIITNNTWADFHKQFGVEAIRIFELAIKEAAETGLFSDK